MHPLDLMPACLHCQPIKPVPLPSPSSAVPREVGPPPGGPDLVRSRVPVVFFTHRGVPGETRESTDTVTAALRQLKLPGGQPWGGCGGIGGPRCLRGSICERQWASAAAGRQAHACLGCEAVQPGWWHT